MISCSFSISIVIAGKKDGKIIDPCELSLPQEQKEEEQNLSQQQKEGQEEELGQQQMEVQEPVSITTSEEEGSTPTPHNGSDQNNTRDTKERKKTQDEDKAAPVPITQPLTDEDSNYVVTPQPPKSTTRKSNRLQKLEAKKQKAAGTLEK